MYLHALHTRPSLTLVSGIVRAFGLLFAAVFVLVGLAVFNSFALTLVFSYFNDIVYEAIFFFLLLAVSVNVGVLLLVASINFVYGR